MGILSLLPTLLLLLSLAAFSWLAYQMYIFANDLTTKGKQAMAKNNIDLSQDGMKIGVEKRSNESLEGAQQRGLVNAWNHASFPGYKSRIWKSEGGKDGEGVKSGADTPTSPRQPTPRRVTPSSILRKTS